ncbi:MAG: PDC sensor domain-containing protein, partial [Campylobacter upsaliensis]
MLIKDIQKFEDNRYKARAYMSYILIRNLPDRLPNIHLESVREALDKIAHDVSAFDALYILDNSGTQIENAITLEKKYEQGAGEDRSSKAYFYRAVKLKRCILSDPYPSILNNELCVTASMPIYDDKEN